jgi:hypothetical protein
MIGGGEGFEHLLVKPIKFLLPPITPREQLIERCRTSRPQLLNLFGCRRFARQGYLDFDTSIAAASRSMIGSREAPANGS